MTVYLNFRSAAVGGSVIDPYGLEGNGSGDPVMLTKVATADLVRRVAGKDVLFAVHGFNVDYENGARSLGRLETALALGPSEFFIGILWPGDWWLPAVNYPFEGATSIKCGQRLAKFCNTQFGGARSISFASHSLGARLVLEAVENLNTKARVVCLTAGAINDDCLIAEYSAAKANSLAVSTLASREDLVLRLAFPVGDVIADLLNEDHAFGEPALGRSGPETPLPSQVAPSQIPDDLDYDHGNYFPPSDPQLAGTSDKWMKVKDFVLETFRSSRPTWP